MNSFIRFDLKKLSIIVGGFLIGINRYIYKIYTDTRNVEDLRGCLFVYLGGENNINKIFLKAYLKGCVCFLLNKYVLMNGVSLVLVKNLKNSLFRLTCWLRRKSIHTKFIAVTGSTGKTTIKEISSKILKSRYKILNNYGNYNNEIGVFITLLNLYNDNFKYVVLELGANKNNDIGYLSKIIKPDVSLISNISVSHVNGFKNLRNIYLEKGKIFKYLSNSGLAVLNFSNYNKFWVKYFKNKDILIFSLNKCFKNIYLYVNNLRLKYNKSVYYINTLNGRVKIKSKLLGIHNVINVLSAVSLVSFLDISLYEIKLVLENFLPIKGRLCPIIINKNLIIYDDSYNSNPRSFYYSLYFFSNINGNKILIIGDMKELGNYSVLYHAYFGSLIKCININLILSYGLYSYLFVKDNFLGKHFYCKRKLVDFLKKSLLKNCLNNVLLKGSRSMNMEDIISLL